MSQSIRYARSADLGEILAIEGSWPTTPHWTRAMFETELRSKRSQFLVLEQDGAILGYAVFWNVAGEAQIMDIAVKPETAGQGLGKLLLGHVLERSRELGLAKASLEVSAKNEPALRLYRALGFGVVGRRPKFYNDGSDAILMDKRLP